MTGLLSEAVTAVGNRLYIGSRLLGIDVMSDPILLAGLILIPILTVFIQVPFLSRVSDCLARIDPRNREIEPSMVYFALVPYFNVVWVFVVIRLVELSLRREFQARQWSEANEEFGARTGYNWGIFTVVSAVPCLGIPCIIGTVAYMCLYSAQISRYQRRLDERPGNYRHRLRVEDDVDLEPRLSSTPPSATDPNDTRIRRIPERH
jgi:hypothetical protein